MTVTAASLCCANRARAMRRISAPAASAAVMFLNPAQFDANSTAAPSSAAAIPMNPIIPMRIDCALVVPLTRSATGLDQRPPLTTRMTAVRKSKRPPATAGYGPTPAVAASPCWCDSSLHAPQATRSRLWCRTSQSDSLCCTDARRNRGDPKRIGAIKLEATPGFGLTFLGSDATKRNTTPTDGPDLQLSTVNRPGGRMHRSCADPRIGCGGWRPVSNPHLLPQPAQGRSSKA